MNGLATVMNVPILCLIALFLLGWVLLLKLQISEVKKENEKFREKIELIIKRARKERDVEVYRGDSTWGRKPSWI